MVKLTKYAKFSRSLPSFLYKFLAQQYIDLEYPRHLFIETTANCNLACEFCPREKIKNDIDFTLFKEIVDESTHYGPKSFSLHLFGEPLLYPRILEAIRYIKEQNKRHTVLLTTNGTLLNKFAQELEALGVDKIIWSYRKHNFNEASRRLLKKHGLIRFLIEETPEGEIEQWKGYEKEVKHLHNYGGNIKVEHEPQVGRYPCYHLFLAPAVRWNGEIVECCNIPQPGTEVLGKYGEVNIRDVWKGSKLSILRDSHLAKIYPGACKGCNSWQAYPSIW